MSTWLPEKRPYKEDARRIATGYEGITYDTALFMPGDRALCVASALKTGIIVPDTRLVLVERIPEVARQASVSMRKMGFRSLPLWHVADIVNLRLPFRLQYGFLDFNGTLNFRIAKWMNVELSSHLASDATLAFTFCYTMRSPGWQFMDRCQKLFRTTYHHLWDRLAGQVQVRDFNILTYLCLLRSVFCEYDFAIRPPFKYKDSVSMVLYRLSQMRPRLARPEWPNMEELLAGEIPEENHQVALISQRAKQAQATRQRQVEERLAQKRSEAALKAWATRRRNEL